MRAIRTCHCTFSDAVASVPLALLHSNFLRLLLFICKTNESCIGKTNTVHNPAMHGTNIKLRTSPFECRVFSVACGQYPVARGLGDMTSWLVPRHLMKPHKWRSINLGASYRVPHLRLLFQHVLLQLRMKLIGFHEKGQRREIWASLYLHGLSISFIPWTNLGITWLFILSWITVANQGYD
jgi:hypothetical protein